MNNFSFDNLGFKINSQDSYLISGEFHYFRVPRSDWRRRMQLFLDAGGNCLATYVPWTIHEPVEGNIRFNDIDSRDLRSFLELAGEMGLMVILRPGPYQYSELYYAGLPVWLFNDYPEVIAVNLKGEQIYRHSVSYVHPTFLKKARRYYKAFADEVRPYLIENGGPVCMLQIDNELSGIHTWYGSLDYHPVSMGFYRPDGRYPLWLRQKYGTIEALNQAYHTNYLRFEYVLPIAESSQKDAATCRRLRDYSAFYRATMAEYLSTLASWLKQDGLSGIICHNSASPNMNSLFTETIKSLDSSEPFLLSSDHYYSLNQSWPQNNPTPQYALRILMSCDTLRAMGMPPSAMELPGGSLADTPPILGNDLSACYMLNLALGVKGVNYYIFTGGPNFPGTGETCDIYDYGAPIHADGTINEPCYAAVKTFGQFMKEHTWLQRAHRYASVQIGFEWNTLQCDDFDYAFLPFGVTQTRRFLEKGLLYSLMCSCYSPEMVPIDAQLDLKRPLIVPCPAAMSKEAQQTLIKFIQQGGHALLLPIFPETDLEYQSANLFTELLGHAYFTMCPKVGPAIQIDGVGHIFGVNCVSVCEKLPEHARTIATDDTGEKVIGFEMSYGAGQLLWFGGSWELTTFPQAAMLEHFIRLMGGCPCVESSNRNIFTSILTDDQGQRELFVMNLYSSPQSTNIRVAVGDTKDIGILDLAPMEVRAIDL